MKINVKQSLEPHSPRSPILVQHPGVQYRFSVVILWKIIELQTYCPKNQDISGKTSVISSFFDFLSVIKEILCLQQREKWQVFKSQYELVQNRIGVDLNQSQLSLDFGDRKILPLGGISHKHAFITGFLSTVGTYNCRIH